MEEGKNAFKILTGIPIGKRPQEDLGVDGRIILEWILRKYTYVNMNNWVDSSKDRDCWKSPC